LIEPLPEPRLSYAEMTPDRRDGHADDFGGFLGRHSPKEAHFDETRLEGVVVFQLLKRFIDGEDLGRLLDGSGDCLVEGREDRSLVTLAGIVGPRMIDEDLPHDLRRHAEEVRPACVIRLMLFDQTGIRFVHERGRLQCMVLTFVVEIAASQPLQFGVQERDQAVEGSLIPCGEVLKKHGNGRWIAQGSVLAIGSRDDACLQTTSLNS